MADIDRLISGASSATCSPGEKEILVNRRNLDMRMKQLRGKGFKIVGNSTGSSLNPKGKVKIWFFNPAGGGLI